MSREPYMLTITEHFYTQGEAAVIIGVERHTIARWVASGRLKAQRVGGIVFIERSEVDALTEGKVPASHGDR